MKWDKKIDGYRVEYSRVGVLGQHETIDNAHTLEEGRRSGSFGEYPALRLEVSFPIAHDQDMRKLSKALRKFVDDWFENKTNETGEKQ